MKLWQFHLEEQVKLKKEVGALTTCPKCGATIQPHRACMACGFYKGKDVLNKETTEETTK